MSYPRDLDEIPEQQLRAELRRRESLQQIGHCDYCSKPKHSEPGCKFPERHGRVYDNAPPFAEE